ncbi:hypothetical protein DFH29DRAFT_134836 [Suillus ampliporus]|nr:hypothetical protein DFH29DRAFT_134836 [Suillus ampliporus]
MGGIPLVKATFLGLFLETLFYGIFFALYWLTLFILLKKPGMQRQLLIPVVTLLLCIATAHLIVDFFRGLEAFVFQADTIGATVYYSNLASPLDLASTALYIIQTTLADGVLVWRCYVLNNRSLFIAIPGCIVLLVSEAIACYVVWAISRLRPLTTTSFADSACIITFYISTMFTSVICTSTSIAPDLQAPDDQINAALIAWRIYRTRHFLSDGLATLSPIIIVIFESGALYATSVFALLLAFRIGSNAQFIMLDIITPIMGITFCLIVLQVHFKVGGYTPTKQPGKSRVIITSLFRRRGIRDIGFSMVPLTVRIAKETEIVQSDLMGGKNGQLVSRGIFR